MRVEWKEKEGRRRGGEWRGRVGRGGEARKDGAMD